MTCNWRCSFHELPIYLVALLVFTGVGWPRQIAEGFSSTEIFNIFSKRCSQSSSLKIFETKGHKLDESSKFEIQKAIHPTLTRRELISLGPIVAAAISSAHGLSAQAYPEAELFNKQQIPFSTSRQYKSTILPNGLRVLLVSDKLAIRASAAFSIAHAGQFSDPADLPGLAHLMEHMVLSSNTITPLRKSSDFEDWLSENEGASNAFTGYEQVCFHFNCPPTVLSEALARFSGLFNEPEVFKVCRNEEVLKREVRRVASELDFSSEAIQSFYLVKSLMNSAHPFSRFDAGDVDTLERLPKEAEINVGRRLFEFFRKYYQPSNAILVVVGQNDLNTLERWVSPFSGTLSRVRNEQAPPRIFPEPFRDGSRMRQLILYRPKVDFPLEGNIETLSFQWGLSFDYNDPSSSKPGRMIVTAPQVGFVISQILGRRGPGSLYYILFRRGWVPPGMQGLPRITFPVDVSGFQLMKLEIKLTLTGFLNRAVVVSDVYRAINSVFRDSRFLLSRQILAQYAVVAQLHGYVLAPRPPDAVELAVDSLTVGIDGTNGVGTGEWRRFPFPNDRQNLSGLQRAVKEAFALIRDPTKAIIICTATDKALKMARETSLLGESVPFASPRWQTEPLSGAKYYRDDLLRFQGIVGGLLAAKVEEDELLPPLTNNLIPPALRAPRILRQYIDVNEGRDENWRILLMSPTTSRLPIPRKAPEASCRCSFVFQLLSPRPARANTRQAAYAELWKISFENAVTDLAELGAPAGCAYEVSFNKYGMRLCFLGISQNLPSYTRRFCRRLVAHHTELLSGQEYLDKFITDRALYDAKRTQGLSNVRRREIETILKGTTAYEAATEAIAFFKSCRGGCAFSQGDLLPSETSLLFNDLQKIFRDVLGTRGKSVAATPIPSINDLVYSPVWMPRFASSCAVPGVPLLSDACGRVPR